MLISMLIYKLKKKKQQQQMLIQKTIIYMTSTNCNTAALLLFITAVFVSIIVGSISYVSTTILLYISAIFILTLLGGGFISIINSMLILIFVGVLIFVLGHSKSVMDKKIGGSTYFTRWCFSHFMLYFIIGNLCPHHLKEFMIIGVLWEIIERIITTMTESQNLWTNKGWGGQLTDLFMNLLGYKFSELFYGIFNI